VAFNQREPLIPPGPLSTGHNHLVPPLLRRQCLGGRDPDLETIFKASAEPPTYRPQHYFLWELSKNAVLTHTQ